ncbi:hypothetical protein ABZ299_28015 [Streptomyces sp. NPDC006184]|uniref:hypothetical protein n=1 Tax=Streptomyces sp. NPDC006184 TaxID=3155455 RepID=UPI0033A6221C
MSFAVAGAVVFEGGVDEGLELVRDFHAVDGRDGLPGEGEVLVRQLRVGVVLAVLVVADDPHPVPARGLLAVLDGLEGSVYTPFDLLLEAAGVLAHGLVLGQLAPQPGRRPDLPDQDGALQQVAEAAAVILVGVGQREDRKVGRLAVGLRKGLLQAVDDGGDHRVVLVGRLHVPQVHLHHQVAAQHDRGGVTRAHRPEHHPLLGKFRLDHVLPLHSILIN